MINIKVLFLMLFLLPVMVFAEAIYKWRGADGAMTYSAEPPPEGVAVELISIVPSPQSTRQQDAASQSRHRVHTAREAADALVRKTNARIQQRQALQSQLRQAKKTFEQTKRALADGQTPLPGERLGRAGGGTRLGPAYQKRINELEKNIEAAELNIKKTKRSLRDLSH